MSYVNSVLLKSAVREVRDLSVCNPGYSPAEDVFVFKLKLTSDFKHSAFWPSKPDTPDSGNHMSLPDDEGFVCLSLNWTTSFTDFTAAGLH